MQMFYLLVLSSLLSLPFEAGFFSKLIGKLSDKKNERRIKRRAGYYKTEVTEPEPEIIEAESEPEETTREVEMDIVPDEVDEIDLVTNKENQHLMELSKAELAAGNLDTGIDCLIAATLNTEDEQQRSARQKECIALCRRNDPKTGLPIKTKLLLADALEGNLTVDPKELFQKARKYTAAREYTKARDLLLALYLSGDENRFDCIYRCGMISMKQRKFYLARGFFLIASELVEEENCKWPQVAMKIARCQEMITKGSPKADSIVKRVIELHSKYKPTDEEEKKLFDRINNVE